MHTYTCTTAYPAGQSMFRLRWSWFDTITYGVGYTGEGLWFDLRRHGIQEKRLWLWTHVVWCVCVLVWEMIVRTADANIKSTLNISPCTLTGRACIYVFVCSLPCSCSHSVLFSLHRFWHKCLQDLLSFCWCSFNGLSKRVWNNVWVHIYR